jgi:hypothetical protein
MSLYQDVMQSEEASIRLEHSSGGGSGLQVDDGIYEDDGEEVERQVVEDEEDLERKVEVLERMRERRGRLFGFA